MENFIDGHNQVSPTTPIKIAGDFIWLSFRSILIGLGFGLLPTLMTKHFRFLSHSSIFEASILISFAMMSYFLSDLWKLSGIVSLLVCTLVMSHYGWYNLSPQGKHVTSVTFQTLGYIAEAAVFGFVGVSAEHYVFQTPFCWGFVVAGFFIVMIGRYAAVYIAYYIFACCPCGSKENYLTFKQLTFLAWAALIRGAIAFGLIARVTQFQLEAKDLNE